MSVESPDNRGRGMSMWILAVVLIVVGVLVARLVRAALAPGLQREPMQFEAHIV